MFEFKIMKYYKISFYSPKYRFQPKRYKSIFYFLNDLITSSIITLLVYFFFYFLIYICINFNVVTDPSQEFQNSNLCSNDNQVESNDLVELSNKIIKVLSQENKKYFLCYRSLIYILKFNVNFYDKNFLDLCIYDSDTTAHDIKNNIQNTFGFTNLEIYWSNLADHESEFRFEFNSLQGYYKFTYRKAEIYLYVFIKALSTKLEFESITRSGIIYTQFENVLKKFYSSTDEMNRKIKINSLNKIPSYMVDEMIYKINITHNYIYLPLNPFDMLMFFYPRLWHMHNKENSEIKCLF